MFGFNFNGQPKKTEVAEQLPKATTVTTTSHEEYTARVAELQREVKGTDKRYFVTYEKDPGVIESSVLVEDYAGKLGNGQ